MFRWDNIDLDKANERATHSFKAFWDKLQLHWKNGQIALLCGKIIKNYHIKFCLLHMDFQEAKSDMNFGGKKVTKHGEEKKSVLKSILKIH